MAMMPPVTNARTITRGSPRNARSAERGQEAVLQAWNRCIRAAAEHAGGGMRTLEDNNTRILSVVPVKERHTVQNAMKLRQSAVAPQTASLCRLTPYNVQRCTSCPPL